MSHTDVKRKVTIYVPNPLYDTLMDEVFKRMKEKRQFRGLITEVVVEALRQFFDEGPWPEKLSEYFSKKEKGWSLEGLINKEASLLAMFLRDEKLSWTPKIIIS